MKNLRQCQLTHVYFFMNAVAVKNFFALWTDTAVFFVRMARLSARQFKREATAVLSHIKNTDARTVFGWGQQGRLCYLRYVIVLSMKSGHRITT